jgi:hypothetical protein
MSDDLMSILSIVISVLAMAITGVTQYYSRKLERAQRETERLRNTRRT